MFLVSILFFGFMYNNIFQVGGLGDVVTSLSRAVQELNHHVDIILPKYDCLNLSNVSIIAFAFMHLSHGFVSKFCNFI